MKILNKLYDAAQIATDTLNRFVTDTQITTWNNKANSSDIPTKTSQLTNDSGFLGKGAKWGDLLP